MNPLLRDTVPPVLYRFFEDLKYAERFLAGEIWLGHLQGYARATSDVRRDEMEGKSRFTYLSEVCQVAFDSNSNNARELPPRRALINVSGTSLTPSYICCFSQTDEHALPMLATRFGPHVVRLNDPHTFIHELSEALKERHDLVGPLECGRVQYANEFALDASPTIEDYQTGSCFMKPIRFADEQEYRMLQRFQLHLIQNPSASMANDEERFPKGLLIKLSGAVCNTELLELKPLSEQQEAP